MRSRSVVLTTLLLVALLGGAVAVVVYDQGRRDTIAEGVRVAGVDVGGLRTEQARARVDRAFVAPLREPIQVTHDGRRFRLGARESRVAVDVGGMVDEALAESRRDNIVVRSWRSLTGGEIATEIEPRATYARAAVVRLLDRVRASVERKPSDARLSYSRNGISVVPGRDGLAVRASELHRDLRRALVDPRADRSFAVRTRVVSPRVSTEQLAESNSRIIVVDRKGYRLRLFKNLDLARSYRIAVGEVGRETPAGLYRISNKAVDPAWTKPDSDWVPKDERGDVVPGGVPENPLKARWLGVYGGVGVHGTAERDSIGTNASKGCIRMLIEDVKALYDEVPVGAPIYIG